MADEQSENYDPQLGYYAQSSSHISTSYPAYTAPVSNPLLRNQMCSPGNATFAPLTPTSNGWFTMNLPPYQPTTPMRNATNGQFRQQGYSQVPATPAGYPTPTSEGFHARNIPYYPTTPMAYNANGYSQQDGYVNYASNRANNEYAPGGGNYRQVRTSELPGSFFMANPIYNRKNTVGEPYTPEEAPPATPAYRPSNGRRISEFNQMANASHQSTRTQAPMTPVRASHLTPALFESFAPLPNTRKHFLLAHTHPYVNEHGQMVNPFYQVQPHQTPTPSQGVTPVPTQSHSILTPNNSGGNKRRCGGEAKARKPKKRGPPMPPEELPLVVDDILPGEIVWLHKPTGIHEPVRCVQAHDCLDPEKEVDGHNHPVLILEMHQREGSDIIGDVILYIAPMTTLGGLSLHDYAEKIRNHGPDISKQWYFPLTMPLEQKGHVPSVALRSELAMRGNNVLVLGRGAMQRQSYVRVNHIYALPLSQLQACSRFDRQAYCVRLDEKSFGIVMHKLGLSPGPWENDVRRSVASAPQRLLLLRDSEMVRFNAIRLAEGQSLENNAASQQRLDTGQQGSLSDVDTDKAKDGLYS